MIGKIENQHVTHDINAELKGGRASEANPFSALMAIIGGQQNETHAKTGISRTNQKMKRAVLISRILRTHDARFGSVPVHKNKHGKLAGVEPKDGAGSLSEKLFEKRKNPPRGLPVHTRMQHGTAAPLTSKRKRQDGDKHVQDALAAPMIPVALRSPVKQTAVKHERGKQAGVLPASKLPLFVAEAPESTASGTQHATAKPSNSVTILGMQHLVAIKTGSGLESHAHQRMKRLMPTSRTLEVRGSNPVPGFVHKALPRREAKRPNKHSDNQPLQSRGPREMGKPRTANTAMGAAKVPWTASLSPRHSVLSPQHSVLAPRHSVPAPPASVNFSPIHHMRATAKSPRPKSSTTNPFSRKAKMGSALRESPGVISNVHVGTGDMQAFRQWREKNAGANHPGVMAGPAMSGAQPATQAPAAAYSAPVHAARIVPALEAIVHAARTGATRIEVQLEPAHLGKIHVVLHSNARQQIHIHIAVEQGASRQIVEEHLPILRQMMAQQGLNPGNFSMDSQQHHGRDDRGQQPSFSTLAERRISRPEMLPDRHPVNRMHGEGYLSIRI